MDPTRCVKNRLLALALLALPWVPAAAEPAPSALDILHAVRLNQVAQKQTLQGHLRTGAMKIPFRLTLAGGTVRYEFPDPPPETIVLTLGEKDARLSDSTREGTEHVTGRKFADSVRGSDISYEDLSLRFLYWQNAKLDKEATITFRKCWVVTVQPPPGSDSQYGHVTLWIDQEAGALMQAEAFDHGGKFARRFRVVSGQKIEGAWFLKQMRIEAPAGGQGDKTPTYLEVEGVAK